MGGAGESGGRATGRAARAEPRGWNPDAAGEGAAGWAGAARRRRRPPNFTRTRAGLLEGVQRPEAAGASVAAGPGAAADHPARAGTRPQALPAALAAARGLPHAAPGPAPRDPRPGVRSAARARAGWAGPGKAEARRRPREEARCTRVSHLSSWPRRGRGGRDLSRSTFSSSCFMEPCAWVGAPERIGPAGGPDARRRPGGAKGTGGRRRKRRRRPGRTRGIPRAAGGLSRAGTRFLRYPSSPRRQ